MAEKDASAAEPKVRPGRQPNYIWQAESAAKVLYPVAEDAAVYVIEQTPAGETVCRLAKKSEGEAFGKARSSVRQINHLKKDGSFQPSAEGGLTIVLRGTSQLEANPTAKAAFIAAAARWEALISSQITVTIDVDYGTTFFGQPYSSSNTLGATSMGGFLPSYSAVRQRLINNAPAGSEEAALVNNLPASSLPTDIGGVSTVFVPTAQARSLGLTFDEATAPVPRIGFNSNFAFDFDPADGINSTQTDFDAVAVHEIGHALGFISEVGARELSPSRPLLATIWDLYRFRPGAGTAATFSTAQRVLTSGASSTDPHVFFGGGGEIALSTGRPDGTGGDGQQSSHWKDDRFAVPFIGIMDPTLPRGRREEITANDLRAVDFFGYTLAGVTPPPPPPAPANDNFASAQAISGSAGSVTGTNVGATKEAGEPSHSDDGNPGGKSVWYNWTAPVSGNVTFTTGEGASGEPGSTFDTVLAAYTGAGVGGLAALAKNDDVSPGVIRTSSITFTAAAGTTYRIAVDGWNADEGSIALNWSFGRVGDQLGCSRDPSPIAVSGGPVGGTLANGDCTNPVDGSFYDAYTFMGVAGQLVIIEMTSSAVDSYLYLLRPNESALTYRTIQNDDTLGPNNTVLLDSRVVAVLPETGTYTILANTALANQTGSYQLHAFSNGNCTATAIGAGTPANTSLAAGDCRLQDNSFVDVYAFTAAAGQQISVTQSSNAVDSFLFLLSTDGFTELARNDDGLTGGGTTNSARGARIPSPSQGAGEGLATLPAAGTYYILASSFSAGEVGDYQLTLSLGANCPVQPISGGQTASGTIATSDCRLPFDGSFLDVYTFEGAANQQLSVTMTSAAFDTYLLLYDPAGFLIDEDDNGAGGTNARIPASSGAVTLPVSGTYRIYANAAAPGLVGAYQLSLTASNPPLRIDTVMPVAGRESGGQQVVLTGSFAGLSSVGFGGVFAPFTFTNGTSEITVTTPPHAPGAVSIDLMAAASGMSYSKPNAFAYLPTTFTDNELMVGVTAAKAQHVLELRQAVDSLRAVAGLQPAQWTNPTLLPTATFIRLVHVTELRARLEEAAAALGHAPFGYTDPNLGAGGVIKRIHIEELRQRIRNIAG